MGVWLYVEGNFTVVPEGPAEDPADLLGIAAQFIRQLDARVIESAALARLEWNGTQSIVQHVLDVVAEAMENAGTQSAADEEVRTGSDDGSGEDLEGSGDLGRHLE